MISDLKFNLNGFATTSEAVDKNEEKEQFKKKKKRIVYPNVRFNVKIEKPSSDIFTQYNYNKILLKALVRRTRFTYLFIHSFV